MIENRIIMKNVLKIWLVDNTQVSFCSALRKIRAFCRLFCGNPFDFRSDLLRISKVNDLPGFHHDDFLRNKLHIGNNMRTEGSVFTPSSNSAAASGTGETVCSKAYSFAPATSSSPIANVS